MICGVSTVTHGFFSDLSNGFSRQNTSTGSKLRALAALDILGVLTTPGFRL